MKVFALVLLFPWLFSVGCGRNAGPPEPLPVEQLPAALQQAFSKAKPDIKEVADKVVALVEAKDYSKAFWAMQHLSTMAGLTKDQNSVTTRGLLTLNGLLQAAQTQGDQKAAQTLKNFRGNR